MLYKQSAIQIDIFLKRTFLYPNRNWGTFVKTIFVRLKVEA